MSNYFDSVLKYSHYNCNYTDIRCYKTSLDDCILKNGNYTISYIIEEIFDDIIDYLKYIKIINIAPFSEEEFCHNNYTIV